MSKHTETQNCRLRVPANSNGYFSSTPQKVPEEWDLPSTLPSTKCYVKLRGSHAGYRYLRIHILKAERISQSPGKLHWKQLVSRASG